MSSEDAELKAGHPPAVKAGGMRVVTKHRHKEPESDAYDQKYKDSVSPMGPAVKTSVKADVVMSGGIGPEEMREQHPVAVRQYHDKPQPTHEKSHSPSKPNIRVNQPRRLN